MEAYVLFHGQSGISWFAEIFSFYSWIFVGHFVLEFLTEAFCLIFYLGKGGGAPCQIRFLRDGNKSAGGFPFYFLGMGGGFLVLLHY